MKNKKHYEILDAMATRHLKAEQEYIEAEQELLETIRSQQLEIEYLKINQKTHIEACVDNYECREMEE